MDQSTHKEWGRDVYPQLSWFRTEKVRNARVLVAGAGALGNEVLKNLVLFGVGHIVVVDFDRIEYANLTRSILFREQDASRGLYKAQVAAARLKEINPSTRVTPVCGHLYTDVGLGLFRRMDVVIGCLDNLQARIQLNRLCFRAGKTWIDGGIFDLEGQVSMFSRENSCYECTLTKTEKEGLDARMSCSDILHIHQSAGRIPTTPVSASIIGAIQVQEALKYIHRDNIPIPATSLLGKLSAYEGWNLQMHTAEFAAYKDDCPSHDDWNPVCEIPRLSANTPVGEALAILRDALGASSVEINLCTNYFVDRIESRRSHQCFAPMLPASLLPGYVQANEELLYLHIAEGFNQHTYENIGEDFPYPQLTLKQTGVPFWDVVCVTTEKGIYYVELSNDKDYYEEYAVE